MCEQSYDVMYTYSLPHPPQLRFSMNFPCYLTPLTNPRDISWVWGGGTRGKWDSNGWEEQWGKLTIAPPPPYIIPHEGGWVRKTHRYAPSSPPYIGALEGGEEGKTVKSLSHYPLPHMTMRLGWGEIGKKTHFNEFSHSPLSPPSWGLMWGAGWGNGKFFPLPSNPQFSIPILFS